MELIKKISYPHILNREFNKFFEKIILLDLQIALQRKLDPEEVSARKPIRYNQQGQPISYEEIKRKEHIAVLEKEREDAQLILDTIKELEENT